MRFLADTQSEIGAYDAVFTGDLGVVGSTLLQELLEKQGVRLGALHCDCGMMIYDREAQDVHAGGSGCGCSASVLCAKILPDLNSGKLRSVLFIATGALLSATTAGQGKSIPSIAHLVQLVRTED